MKQNNIQIPEGYKNSSLGIIPNDWEVKRLGEVCSTFKSGYSITSKNIFETGIYPVYGGNGLRGYTSTYTHDGEYILIGRQGALCGNITYCIGKQYISEHAIAVQAEKNNSLKFLIYKLDFWNLNRFSESSAQPGLSVEKLIRYKLALPPLPQQQKIAEILGAWDEAIEKQNTLIDKLTERKRGLMQQLLTGKKRLAGFNEDWKEVRLGEMFKERNETNINNLPLLSITANKGVIYQADSEKKDNSNEDKSKYKRICKGDIGYNTMRMWQGRSALSNLDGIISPAYTVVIPKTKSNALFFSYLFKMPIVINNFWRHSQGLVSDTLNCKFKDFKLVKVFIPCYIEQTAIANILTAADKEIELATSKLELLRNQKSGLMQQLLTGKTRVKID